MNPLVVDIETDGLLENATTIWCIVAKELGKNKWWFYAPDIQECYNMCNKDQTLSFISNINTILKLFERNTTIFHNGIGFDIPLIRRFYLDFKPKQVEDTFILSSLFEPDRMGGHSLEQYGKEFGMYKQEHEDWTQFSIEMLQRCFRDVEITEKVWNYLSKERADWDWEQAIHLEYTTAKLCAQMQLNGVLLDQDLAKKVLLRINNELENIDNELLKIIPKQITNKSEGGAKMTEVRKICKKDGSYTKQIKDWFNRS